MQSATSIATSIAGNKLTSFGWLRVGVMASLLAIAAFAVVALYSPPDLASAQSNTVPVIGALPTDLTIAENATGNVGSPFTATDADAGDTISWSVGGADGDEFSMDSASGQLSVTTGLDYTGLNYEDGATRSLTVTASDGNGGTDSEAVTVTVTDVREPPGRPAAPRVAVDANSPTTSIVTWSAPTNTGPPITRYYIRYCLDSTGCNQNSEWSDYPSTADTTVTIANLREGETHSVRVRAKNNEGQSPWSAIGNGATITASVAAAPGKPGAPTVTGKYTKLTVTWSAPSSTPAITGYNVQYRVLTDPVSGTWLTHNHTGTGIIATITGLNNGTEYEVQVRAIISGGLGDWSDSGSGTPNNIPPVITGGSPQTISVREDIRSGKQTNIGAAFTATDPDGNTFLWNWKLGGADKDSFWLGKEGGQLSVRAETRLDYESQPSYSLTVTARDANGGTDTINVTVSITDVDEPPGKPDAPTVTLTSGSTTSLDVSWNEPTRIGGPDVNDYDVQYRMRDAASWTSHAHTGVATTATISPLTANKIYEVHVRAINPEGTGDWSDSTIRITGTAPYFESASLTIDVYDVTPGGAMFGAPVTAIDPEGGTITHTLGGTHVTSFTIDAATGQLSLHTDNTLAADEYSITVTATDSNSETSSVDVTVNVETCGGFWCATMTAGFSSPNMGYSAPSNGTLLPSSVFEYGGTTYTVTRLARITQTDGGTGTGRFEFKLNPDTNTVYLEELVLEYGHAAQSYSDTFALADTFERTAPGDPYKWTFSLIWNQGSADNSEIGTVHELKLVEKESIDYDADDDGLIDISTVPQLAAIEFDPNGDGEVGTPDQTKYDTAFPYALAGMGCPAAGCTGYELHNNLDFGATDWNGRRRREVDAAHQSRLFRHLRGQRQDPFGPEHLRWGRVHRIVRQALYRRNNQKRGPGGPGHIQQVQDQPRLHRDTGRPQRGQHHRQLRQGRRGPLAFLDLWRVGGGKRQQRQHHRQLC